MTEPRTIFQKIWDSHVVATLESGGVLLYVDRHLVQEVTSPQAFEGLRAAGRRVRCPEGTVAVADHNIPTERRAEGIGAIADPESRLQVETLERNILEFGVPYVRLKSISQGIVHIIGPELGLTLPGTVLVCGDSHTSTHGALGALAFGIGTSEVEHVLATQTIVQQPAKTMLIEVSGTLAPGISAKDLALFIIGRIGAGGANGHVIEYAGEGVRALDMAGRMTLCNMAIEAGARAGMIAPDEVTFAWLKGRPFAPTGEAFAEACAYWQTFRTDPGARYDHVVMIDASVISPMVTWGTSPEAVIAVTDSIPQPQDACDDAGREQAHAMLNYMDLVPGASLSDASVDVVFIGSCTNGRIEDLRAAANVVGDRHVSPHVRAMIVPGSGQVKALAEAEGLDRIFRRAGFEWRDPGCSMCLAMNADKLAPGQRCASTANRNFEGRQGPGGRTHLMSPAMAAAAAIAGRIVDFREEI